jgi:hypothetical protein
LKIKKKSSHVTIVVEISLAIFRTFEITGGGNDELNADGGKSIKLLNFLSHGLVVSYV